MLAAGLLSLTFVAGACGDSGGNDGGRVGVVASFYPLAEVAGRVGGPDVEVENLTQPGTEPHDLELSTRQVDHVLDADLVVVMGHRFQPAVEEVAAKRDDASTVVVLDELGTAGGSDPHVWLDPTRMRRVVEVVRDGLIRAVPSKRADLRRRAAAYMTELEALDARYRDGLAHCRTRTIVTSHAAYGWLARRYDLDEEAIGGLSPEQEPDPRRLSQLVDLVARRGVTTVFTETLVSPKVAETLAREAGVRSTTLDPIEGLSKARIDAGDDYVTVMDENLAKLRAALGCDP